METPLTLKLVTMPVLIVATPETLKLVTIPVLIVAIPLTFIFSKSRNLPLNVVAVIIPLLIVMAVPTLKVSLTTFKSLIVATPIQALVAVIKPTLILSEFKVLVCPSYDKDSESINGC